MPVEFMGHQYASMGLLAERLYLSRPIISGWWRVRWLAETLDIWDKS